MSINRYLTISPFRAVKYWCIFVTFLVTINHCHAETTTEVDRARNQRISSELASTCQRHQAFTNNLLQNRRPIGTVFSALRDNNIWLIGESHDLGGMSEPLYRDLFSQLLWQNNKVNCLIMEMDQKDQIMIDRCFGKPLTLEVNKSCYEYVHYNTPSNWRALINTAKNQGLRVIAIDDKSGDESLGILEYYRKRNQTMARRIHQEMSSGRCTGFLGVFGAAHLTGDNKQGYQSLTSMLKSHNIHPSQINVFTSNRQTDSGTPDLRWQPIDFLGTGAPICRYQPPFHPAPWVVRGDDLTSHPYLPFGLESPPTSSEPFGDWKDFDFSISIGNYGSTP